jgi:tetratricopeptide (TPR) repeat protein
MAVVYHSLGRQDDAKRELEKLIALDGDSVAAEIAGIYAQLGNKAAALQWLTKAEQQYDSGLQSLKIDWTHDPIRNEPQFKAIEKRMNFPP